MSNSSDQSAKDALAKLGVRTFSVSYEMTIDSPVQRVWACMVNYHDWNPEHMGARAERLAGERGSEGEIILESKKAADGYEPPVVIETVKAIPNEKIVWAMYSPQSGAESGIFFVDFTIRDANGRTLFTYNSYGWLKDVERKKEYERAAFQAMVLERLSKIIPALKQFAESGASIPAR